MSHVSTWLLGFAAMATKARHLKTPIQLWIADNRKRLGLEPGDLAQLTGVTEDTARGWESRGRPSEDAIATLERRFGVPAPRGEQATVGGDSTAAIDRQTDVLRQLVEETRKSRIAQEITAQAVGEMVGRLDQFLGLVGRPSEPEPANGGGSR